MFSYYRYIVGLTMVLSCIISHI